MSRVSFDPPWVRKRKVKMKTYLITAMSVVAWGNCLHPPLLLCHGGMDSAATFRPLLKLLPDNFYYVAVELPGNGKSDHLPPGLMLNIFDLVYCVDLVVKHFRWDTFVFIGHSLGGYIGKMYNFACPKKISKFIEIDPINFFAVPPEHFGKWYDLFYQDYYDNMDKYDGKKRYSKQTFKKAVETLKKVRGLPDDIAASTLERWTEPAGDGYIRYTLDPRYRLVSGPPLSPEHIKKIFTELTTPTLTIVSQISYNKGLYRNTAFLLDEKIYPNNNYRSRFVNEGHDLHCIRPDLVADFVVPFLLGGVNALDAKAKL